MCRGNNLPDFFLMFCCRDDEQDIACIESRIAARNDELTPATHGCHDNAGRPVDFTDRLVIRRRIGLNAHFDNTCAGIGVQPDCFCLL